MKYCNKILCVDRKPTKPYLLFFGDTGHFIRQDIVYYPVFKNLYEKATADFWVVSAVDFSKDRVGWERLDNKAKRMFLLNNGYQTLMDSGVVNIYNELVKITSNSELALLYQYIAFNEAEHSRSYSWGLMQMFGSEAEEKIDIVYSDNYIKHRLDKEVDYSSEFIKRINNLENENLDEVKKSLIKVLISTYVLEHIKFPLSFFITWRINEAYDNAIQGFSMLLKLIAWDELTTHTVTNGRVLKILLTEERQEFTHLKDFIETKLKEHIKDVVQQEIEWGQYLLKEGNIRGITADIIEHFLRFQADKCLKFVGLNPMFNEGESDVTKWYNNFRNINKQNSALQEVSNTAYQKGKVKNDLFLLYKKE